MKFNIDWHQQWSDHAKNFHNGCVHLSLQGCEALKLMPGPGFGDLSHPTTRLVLQLMASKVRGKHVIDMGCGSGVLSIAAHTLGAASVHAIDIDPDALEHARANSSLNGMEKHITFGLPGDYSALCVNKSYFLLMNMIQSEQSIAWNSVNKIHSNISEAITSGILIEGMADYQILLNEWKLNIIKTVKEDQWIAFHCLYSIKGDI